MVQFRLEVVHQFAAGYAVAKNTDGHSRLLFYATLLPLLPRRSSTAVPDSLKS